MDEPDLPLWLVTVDETQGLEADPGMRARLQELIRAGRDTRINMPNNAPVEDTDGNA